MLAPLPRHDLIMAVSQYAATVHEALPLIYQHAEEVGLLGLPVEFHPDSMRYIEMERRGLVSWVVVRDAQVMVGYLMLYEHPSLLFAGKKQVYCEAVYVRPEYRRTGIVRELWEWALCEARRRGAVCVSRSMWKRKGGRRPTQETRWTFLGE